MEHGQTNTQGERVTLVGIDEAGYGPVLGPLVVSATAFDVPAALLEGTDAATGLDLWKLLSRSVSRRVTQKGMRLAVADSKKLFKRNQTKIGLRWLERAALTFFGLIRELPDQAGPLMEYLNPGLTAMLKDYPWYGHAPIALPTCCTPEDISTQKNSLAKQMSKCDVRFCGIWSEVLPEGHFNQLVDKTRNKAIVSFSRVTRLMQRVADDTRARQLRIWVDRQGGRIGYRRPLMTAFEDGALEVLGESEAYSGYRLTRPCGPWDVHFVMKGEDYHMPIALASVVSKYLRELLMEAFNAYWAGHVTDLRPTAGYFQDGRRFLADIEPMIGRLRIRPEMLIRRL